MTNDPYNRQVRALFEATRHGGALDGAQTADCDSQGVRLTLYATLGNAGVDQLRYRILGCPHSIAVCEAFCAQYEGRAVSELENFSATDLMQSLAVPAAKSGRILALEDTVRQLGATLRESQES